MLKDCIEENTGKKVSLSNYFWSYSLSDIYSCFLVLESVKPLVTDSNPGSGPFLCGFGLALSG